jgi:putative ABC transport system substrate-binding protein
MQFDRVKRGEFITLLGGAAAAWPLAARAQRPAMPVIGHLNSTHRKRTRNIQTPFEGGCKVPGMSKARL